MRSITFAAAAVLGVSGAAIAASSGQGPALPRINVAMDGTSITVGGTLQSGAVNVVSTTTREEEGDPILVRLNPGVTADQILAFANSRAGQDFDNLAPYGAIVFDAQALRGVSAVQTDLQPGQYVAVDTANENMSKQPHTTFTITPAAQPATLPTPGATISAVDFGFRGQKRLHTGELVRFVNRGHLGHMVIFLKLARGADPGNVITLLRQGKGKQAFRFVTVGFIGAGPLSPGGSQQMTLTAAAGTYIVVCFMETQDGRDHTQLGMERVIHIVR